MAIIDMQTMRYINLLERVARVRATKCFIYNNTIYFTVPSGVFSRARGLDNYTTKIISEQLGKRIRIIRDSGEDIHSIAKFIEDIVSPAGFASLDIEDGNYLLVAGSRERAATLIGRNKTRLIELNAIMQTYFGKGIRIV